MLDRLPFFRFLSHFFAPTARSPVDESLASPRRGVSASSLSAVLFRRCVWQTSTDAILQLSACFSASSGHSACVAVFTLSAVLAAVWAVSYVLRRCVSVSLRGSLKSHNTQCVRPSRRPVRPLVRPRPLDGLAVAGLASSCVRRFAPYTSAASQTTAVCAIAWIWGLYVRKIQGFVSGYCFLSCHENLS